MDKDDDADEEQEGSPRSTGVRAVLQVSLQAV